MAVRLNLQELNRILSKPNVDALRTALETADALDSNILASIAALTAEGNEIVYIEGNGDAALTSLSEFMRGVLGEETASEVREALGIGETAVTQAQVAARVSLRV